MADTPTRKDVAKAVRDMDLCFMSTHGADGTISSRPMSNNAQVDWDGDNWFFSHGDTRKVRELEADPAVTLDFQSRDSWITLQGEAELHREKALFADHWTKDLDCWFQAGIDTRPDPDPGARPVGRGEWPHGRRPRRSDPTLELGRGRPHCLPIRSTKERPSWPPESKSMPPNPAPIATWPAACWPGRGSSTS